MADSQSTLQILLQLKDDASSAIAGMAGQTQNSFDSIAESAQKVGIAMIAAGTAITGFLGLAVKSASDEQVAQQQMNVTIGNVIDTAKSAADAHSAFSTQVDFLKAKVDAAKASIAFSTAELDKNGKITSTTSASHQKLEASIQSQQATLEKYQEQLDLLNNTMSLGNDTVEDVSKQFEKAAVNATNLGFQVADSDKSLTNLFASTHSVTTALQAYQIAQDLARAKGVDLQTATGYVEKAFQGQGRALIDLGINLKDGLAGMQALNAIQDVTKGSAESFSKTESGAIDIVKAKQEQMMVQIGDQLLPIILQLTQQLSGIITAVTNWADAHPALFKNIAELLGILGPALIIFGTLFTQLKNIATGVGLVGDAFTFLAANPIVVVIAGLVALGVEIVNIVGAWKDLENQAREAASEMQSSMNISNETTAAMQKASTSAAEAAKLNTLNQQQIQASQAFQNSTSLSGIVGSLFNGSLIGNTGIKGYASGGIVNGPQLAMVGEAGPEAIIPLSAFNNGINLSKGNGGGAGGNIVVNINGGNYLDQDAARMLSDMVAKTLNRQLKLRTI